MAKADLLGAAAPLFDIVKRKDAHRSARPAEAAEKQAITGRKTGQEQAGNRSAYLFLT